LLSQYTALKGCCAREWVRVREIEMEESRANECHQGYQSVLFTLCCLCCCEEPVLALILSACLFSSYMFVISRAERGELADSSIDVDTTSHVSHEYGHKDLALRKEAGGTSSSSSSLTAARVHEHESIVTVGSGKSGNDRGVSGGGLAMPSSWNEGEHQQQQYQQQHYQQQHYHSNTANVPPPSHNPPSHQDYSGDVPEMQRSFAVKPGVGVSTLISMRVCFNRWAF